MYGPNQGMQSMTASSNSRMNNNLSIYKNLCKRSIMKPILYNF